MKLTKTNENYSAIVVRLDNFIELENCDNLKATVQFNTQAIVSKDVEPGTIGIWIGPEIQLSEKFVSANNLYRDSDKNENNQEKGYIEDNRRVRAIKFRGHKTSALFMPLSSLDYLNIPYNDLKVGDEFNEINGIEICKKYELVRSTGPSNKLRGSEKKFQLIDNKTFPEHLDSDNYWRNVNRLNDDDEVIVTQKLHGTSGRFGNCLSRRKLNIIEKILSKFIPINDKVYMSHYGSRRVIKSGSLNKNNKNYYESDVWAIVNYFIKDKIPQDWIIYGEIVGYVDNTPIQKGYTYGLNNKQAQLYVYRISIVNQQGVAVDLSWDAIKEFCRNTGLSHVPELWRGKHKDLDIDLFMDKKYHEQGYNAIPLSKDSPCDEGVVVRKEGIFPYLLKAKCQTFLEHETKQLDKGEIDLESSQS